MKTNRLLAGTVLTAAIGAIAAGFIGDLKGQPMTSTAVPFPHAFPVGLFAGQNELAPLERADGWLNTAPLTASDLRFYDFEAGAPVERWRSDRLD